MRDRSGFPPTLKRLGQHFLADEKALARIVDALDPTENDTVLEIGPGRGALTDLLVPRAGQVIAVELDRALAQILRDRFAGNDRVSIVERDILKTDPGELAGAGYLLVGNVPYYITTPILFHALACALPRRAVFLVQREVAERAMAPEGSKKYGALSVNLQVLARVERVFDIPPGAFRPPPKVDSSVIRITPLADALLTSAEQPRFRGFVQAMFSQRRKQVGTILRSLAASGQIGELLPGVSGAGSYAALESLGIPATERPEQISPARFVKLFRAVRERER